MRKFLIKISTGIVLFFGFMKPALAQAIDDGLDAAARVSNLNTGTTNIVTQAGAVIRYLLGFVGILFFGMVLYAGFLWMTAGGDKNQTTKATTIIKNGVIGLILVMSAYAITNFVVNAALRPTAGPPSSAAPT